MIDLTFSIFDPQISQLEAELVQLQQQISQKKEIKKAIEQKKQLAIKMALMSSFKYLAPRKKKNN